MTEQTEQETCPTEPEVTVPAKRPCGACPYRTDAPSGLWAYGEYVKLIGYDRPMAEQPPNLFMCHEDAEAARLCAGWVGTHNMLENLALRVGLLRGMLTIDTFMACVDYVSPIPLFKSGRAAARHGLEEYSNPSARALRTQEKLERKRAGSSRPIIRG